MMEKAVLNIVFMGTPAFAATILERLARWSGCRVTAAWCQPDRPAGRGKALHQPEVKQAALSLGIPVFQPEIFRTPEARAQLAAFAPDILAVAAYGLILPQEVLDIPRLGAFNVHGSLLPRYRGAAPIQRAIINGDSVSGITIIRMVRAMDAGPMLMQRALGIGLDDTTATLHDELALLGGDLLVESLSALQANAMHEIPQDESRVTFAPKLTKEEGFIDWNQNAWSIHARIRGVTPWPGARATLKLEGRAPLDILLEAGQPAPLWSDPVWSESPWGETPPAPGLLLGLYPDAQNRICLAIAAADRAYLVPSIQPVGKKRMEAKAFANGYLPAHAPWGAALLPSVPAVSS